MIGHLGPRVSALLDGQLPGAESDRLWAHVHLCHVCRDAVEREGWVKTRLAGLGGGAAAPSHLKGALMLGGPSTGPGPLAQPGPPRRHGLTVLGGSAAGMAILGLVAFGLVTGAETPPAERRAPVTNLSGTDAPAPTPRPAPVRVPVPDRRDVLPTSSR